jgi:hypothetical protein
MEGVPVGVDLLHGNFLHGYDEKDHANNYMKSVETGHKEIQTEEKQLPLWQV